jgi:hypothetical protein
MKLLFFIKFSFCIYYLMNVQGAYYILGTEFVPVRRVCETRGRELKSNIGGRVCYRLLNSSLVSVPCKVACSLNR